MEQLQLDIGSHLSMSLNGWTHPLDRQGLYTAALLAQVKNMLRSEGDDPFVPDWPWPQEPDEEAVTDEERAALKAQLQATSAFGQIRTGGLTDV